MYVYLLGAGASAECVPTVNNLAARMSERADQIASYMLAADNKFKNANNDIHFNNNVPRPNVVKTYIEDLKWLAKSSNDVGSVDEYARNLFLADKESDDYRKLKAVLSSYLYMEQSLSRFINRYQQFFRNITTNDNMIRLPKNVKLLTWNYDSQIEISFHSIFKKSTNLRETLNTLPRPSKYGEPNNGFCVVRLNGQAELYKDLAGNIENQINLHGRPPADDPFESFRDAVLIYSYHIMQERHPYINFSWEGDSTRELASTLVKDSKILIVIGYSFPEINTHIDSKILNSMTDLKEVYIQDIDPDTIESKLRRVIKNNNKIDIHKMPVDPLKSRLDSFYIPEDLRTQIHG